MHILTASAIALAALIPMPAHATIVGSTPAEGETLTTLPEQFSVTANEQILVVDGVDTANAMTIQGADGLFYGNGCTSADGATLSTAAALGEAGAYTLTYQLVSADGHAIDGSIDFEWAGTDPTRVATGATTAPVCGQTAAATSTPTASSPTETETMPQSASAQTNPAPSDPADASASDADGVPAWAVPVGIVGLLAIAGIVIAMVRKGRGGLDGRTPME